MSGVVAAGHRETARCGAEILAAGGNAVDAAIAAVAGTFIAEPLLSSAGGGGIMTVALPDQEPVVIDFFSDAPGLGGAAPTELDFVAVEIDFGTVVQEFHVGRGSAAVPGALAGLELAQRRFGSQPLAELMAPAVKRCRAGLEVSEQVAHVYRMLWPIIERDDVLASSFSPTLRPPEPGAAVANPALAHTLAEFGRLGRVPDRVWQSLVADFGRERGGLISMDDVRAYAPAVRAPLAIELGDWKVLTSPAAGGRLVEVILRALAGGTPSANEAEEVVRFAQASASGHREREHVITPGSTTHVSVLDASGGVCAVTLTNGEGCGHLIGDTGIQLNNFLGEEDLNPHGFHRHPPGSRIPTMLAPSVALRNGAPALALGSGGSNRIRTAVGQVLYRIAALGMSLEDAVRAPRAHAEANTVWIEKEGISDSAAAISALGQAFEVVHEFEQRHFFFGGVHAVAVEPDGRRVGLGDSRRGGESLSV